ncbi:MAG: thioesterase [Desulfomicrobiaceae bacterium]|jgi:acyl-CoA thioester hydrolase|nr:thioesterase [Desulfomicrobiaceae bacterium]HCF06422.1 thioesterase [Desulfomicrobiaceae bacterium]
MNVWLAHRVSYGETDAMGVMYYAEYLHLFERGRSEWIRTRGHSYAAIEAQGIYLPVREAQCRYRAPARYDELIWLETWLDAQSRASLTFAYRLMDETKTRLLAQGSTQHAVVDSRGKPVAIPQWLREFLSPSCQ